MNTLAQSIACIVFIPHVTTLNWTRQRGAVVVTNTCLLLIVSSHAINRSEPLIDA